MTQLLLNEVLRRAMAYAKEVIRSLRYHAKVLLTLQPTLKRQLRPTGMPVPLDGPRVLVPMMETSHYQFYQVIILAKALKIRGADVRLLLCDSALPGCELKSVRNRHALDPCGRCRLNRTKLIPQFDIPVDLVSEFFTEPEREGILGRAEAAAENYPASLVQDGVDVIPIVDASVTRYYYGADPPSARELRQVRSAHLATTLMGLHVASRVQDVWAPDVILNNMHVYSAWQPYYEYFKHHGAARRVTLSMTAFDLNRVVMNRHDLFESRTRYERYLAARRNRLLSRSERTELEAFLQKRRSGDAEIFLNLGFFGGVADVRDHLGIDSTKRNIFLFSNVHWDAGLSEHAGLFNGVVDWVLRTIELLADEPDCVLYVKPHPAERFNSSKSLRGIEDIVRDRFQELPANVRFIPPELKLSPYSLFEHIDVGVLFNGTLGLELALSDVPSIVTGQAHYAGLPGIHQPASVAEYRAQLTGALPLTKVDREAAEQFAYFYFMKACIPWSLTRRVYGDDFKGFTFDSLAEIEPGRDPNLDHICNWVLDPDRVVLEAWGPTESE